MGKLYSILFLLVSGFAKAQQSFKLWYDKPASVWTEALPIGNGRLGAMIFGGVDEELIQLNEATLWSGGPVEQNVNPQSPQYLPKVRDALFNGEYDSANALVKQMQGLYSESFMPLGDLTIRQNFKGAKPSRYYRDLNIQDALATTKFKIDSVEYKREIFASAPDQLFVIRLSTNRPGRLNIEVVPSSILHNRIEVVNASELILHGKAPTHVDPSYFNENKEPVIYDDPAGCRGMRFALVVKAKSKDGKIKTENGGIRISNASEVIIYVTAATSFNGYDKCPDKEGKDENAIAKVSLSKAIVKPYAQLLAAHRADFHKYFRRVFLQLNKNNESNSKLPTDERMAAYGKGDEDPGLEALYFQYGRYLLISSSRTVAVPANLQGIWNKELRPPWSSNYTTNINLQMNYWPAEAGNLTEMVEPLIGLIKNISLTGRQTAKEFYNANGSVTHHNSDIWAMSNPVGNLGKGDPKWANWAMGANWLSRHLWEHYLYKRDKKFLKDTAYPLMKEAARFTLDWLVPDGKGYLVTAPSTSPENDYYYAEKRSTGLSIATTMDMGIIRDLFENLVNASELLNIDSTFRDTILMATRKLYPFGIGSQGQLQEWYKDFKDVDPHHRHVSHLYALHPANLISPVKTPELAKAARRTLEIRGDEGTGWSLAWKVNFWARLLDGNKAYALYRNLLRLTRENNTAYNRGGGAYPNLFDAHPPFQIDGNFAGAAGLMEMLLQSQGDEIYLLPALPDAWKQGVVRGLVARGGYEVNINWDNGKLTNAALFARHGGQCTLRSNDPVTVQGSGIHSTKSTIGYVLTFKAVKGKTYLITRNKIQ